MDSELSFLLLQNELDVTIKYN